jgi:hypothetical protein
MNKLTRADLLSLEDYAQQRSVFRTRLIEHRQQRRLQLGEHCTWSFEDRETVRYQIQEMLRAERIFEAAGIQEELDSYNPLIPNGGNLIATMLIEYPDAAERAQRLRQLRGIERCCWMAVAGHERVVAIADEDMERENDEKTSAVHFLRYEFTPVMRRAFCGGALLSAGIEHGGYFCELVVSAGLRGALMTDFL